MYACVAHRVQIESALRFERGGQTKVKKMPDEKAVGQKYVLPLFGKQKETGTAA